MHGVSWRRVKWLRPSWSRKDLLTACGSVLVDTISLGASRLVSSCGVPLLDPSGLVSVLCLLVLSPLILFLWACFLDPWLLWSCLLLSYLIVAPLVASPLDVALLGFALGLLWSRLQAFWKALGEPLGASRGPFGALLETLGGLWGPWAAPGPLPAPLGPSLASSWGPLGPILATLGPLLGRSWPDLRPLLAPLGPVLGLPGPLLGPLGPLLAAKAQFS